MLSQYIEVLFRLLGRVPICPFDTYLTWGFAESSSVGEEGKKGKEREGKGEKSSKGEIEERKK